MREVEVKILNIDRTEIEGKLLRLGAEKVFDDEIHAVYYDTADSAIQKSGGALRLRSEGGKAVLTLKLHIEDARAKVREEKEVCVSDFGEMRSILLCLGYSVRLEMKKHRTTYELEGVRFELDRYHGEHGFIPEFLEIEGKDISEVYHYAGLLGFTPPDCLPWDAVQLAVHYSLSAKEEA
ncbi:MAG: class IV adenylate cyclase [Nitrospirae bacterium]|nr:class IV adenylate cyclase [Nitrospirota bacterium]